MNAKDEIWRTLMRNVNSGERFLYNRREINRVIYYG